MLNILFFGSTSDFAFNTFILFNDLLHSGWPLLPSPSWKQNVLLKFKKKRLNRSDRIEGNQNVLNAKVLNAKSEVEPKKSILNINLCVELN